MLGAEACTEDRKRPRCPLYSMRLSLYSSAGFVKMGITALRSPVTGTVINVAGVVAGRKVGGALSDNLLHWSGVWKKKVHFELFLIVHGG